MEKFEIQLTKKQLQVMAEALEFYSRFSAGQLDYFPNSLQNNLGQKWDLDEFLRRRDIWEVHLDQAKNAMFGFVPNESYGIGNDELMEEARIAYDMYRPVYELWHKLNEHKSDISVYAHPGLQYSEEGRITIKQIEDESENINGDDAKEAGSSSK